MAHPLEAGTGFMQPYGVEVLELSPTDTLEEIPAEEKIPVTVLTPDYEACKNSCPLPGLAATIVRRNSRRFKHNLVGGQVGRFGIVTGESGTVTGVKKLQIKLRCADPIFELLPSNNVTSSAKIIGELATATVNGKNNPIVEQVGEIPPFKAECAAKQLGQRRRLPFLRSTSA